MDNTAPRVSLDPHKQFPGLTPLAAIQMAGILPQWVAQRHADESVKDALIRQYDFYAGPMTGGELHDDGRYDYPGDPTLYPLVALDFPTGERAYIYQYGIVASVFGEEKWISRFD